MDRNEKPFKIPKSKFQQQLNEIMDSERSSNLINDLIVLQMHKSAEKDEKLLVLVEIYNTLGLEKFCDLLDIMRGRHIKFPTKSDFQETVQVALVYYLQKYEGKPIDEAIDDLEDNSTRAQKLKSKTASLEKFLKEFIENRSKALKDD